MSFGLTKEPVTFQATMNPLLKPFLRKFVTFFSYDVLIDNPTLPDHLKH